MPLLTRRRGAILVSVGVGLYLFKKYSGLWKKPKKEKKDGSTKKSSRVFSKEFLRQLRALLKIVLPRIRSRQALILFLHTLALAARTLLSIQVARMDSSLVKYVVTRQKKQFFWQLMLWFGIAIPASYCNSMIRFFESKLAISFRTRLSHHLQNLYMENEVYYRVGNLDSRLENADQGLTEDVANFCNDLAGLWSQVAKPLLDLVFMSTQLLLESRKRGSTGWQSTVLALFAVWSTSRLLQAAAPNFGRMVAEKARLEGSLRFVHTRLINRAEEIAFLGGHRVEEGILKRAYYQLVGHLDYMFKARIFYHALEGFLLKYLWSAVGLTMIAIPAFQATTATSKINIDDASVRTEGFVFSRKMLISLADAADRLLSSFKMFKELAGYTSRVHDLVEVFSDVKDGRCKKGSVTGGFDLSQRGTVIESDRIEFDKVPIVTPAGDVLVESCSFQIKRGMHLLITGPNGCGKSSLFRILGGLWPVYGGTLYKTRPQDLFYIPQRPYVSCGTLRDQVIYPDTVADMKKKGKSDEDLLALLELMQLAHIVPREGGWDSTSDWQTVLSAGEKQCVAISRLFYHKPMFAILDECSSAVSFELEAIMYTHAKELGITLMTVTHRHTLFQYHDYLLQFDGTGAYVFQPLNVGEFLTLREEKVRLEAHLTDVPAMEQRLRQVCTLLGRAPPLYLAPQGVEASTDNLEALDKSVPPSP